MRTFDFLWPENLECSKFPMDGGEEICLSPNVSSSKSSSENFHNTAVSTVNRYDKKNNPKNKNVSTYTHRSIGFVCPIQLKLPQAVGAEFSIGGKTVKNCGIPCSSLFFSDSDRSMLRYFISSMAAISVVCCIFTVFTFIIDSSRFRYPERPICFLAICYLFVSSVFIYGLSSGDSLACRDPVAGLSYGRLQKISTITTVCYFSSIM
jgi:frizzled 1/7